MKARVKFNPSKYLMESIKFFTEEEFTAKLEPVDTSKKGLVKARKELAYYIHSVLGQYCYNTVRNQAPATLADAVKHGYFYIVDGKTEQMKSDTIIDFVLSGFPDLRGDLDAINRKRLELIDSDVKYPFFKVDVVDMNIDRRMKKNGVISVLDGNIKAFSKSKNGHLVGEEDRTRRRLYNTFLSMKQLWLKHQIVVIDPSL